MLPDVRSLFAAECIKARPMTSAPLLSIVVPTYQRAASLRVMLQALLPQAAALGDLVEVCIADNASSDDTPDVVRHASANAPGVAVRYLRRPANLGAIKNLVLGAAQDARGDFIWALGDDDLVTPGALRRICTALQSHRHVDFFYANFATALFGNHWPESAHGGYVGPVVRLACSYPHDRDVLHWQELLDDTTDLGTNLYAHVVARHVWERYWQGRDLPPDYRSVESTYPHTAMLIDAAWNQPARFLAGTHVVQFAERPGWGEGQASRILLVVLPALIALLDDRGLGIYSLWRARQMMQTYAINQFRKVICEGGCADAAEVVSDALALGNRYPELVSAIVVAIEKPGGRLVPRVVEAVRDALLRQRTEPQFSVAQRG